MEDFKKISEQLEAFKKANRLNLINDDDFHDYLIGYKYVSEILNHLNKKSKELSSLSDAQFDFQIVGEVNDSKNDIKEVMDYINHYQRNDNFYAILKNTLYFDFIFSDGKFGRSLLKDLMKDKRLKSEKKTLISMMMRSKIHIYKIKYCEPNRARIILEDLKSNIEFEFIDENLAVLLASAEIKPYIACRPLHYNDAYFAIDYSFIPEDSINELNFLDDYLNNKIDDFLISIYLLYFMLDKEPLGNC